MKLLQHGPPEAVIVSPWLLITAPTPLPAGAAGCSPPPMCKSKLALQCCACHLPLARRWRPLLEGVPGALWKEQRAEGRSQLNAGWDVTCKPQDSPCWSELNPSCFCFFADGAVGANGNTAHAGARKSFRNWTSAFSFFKLRARFWTVVPASWAPRQSADEGMSALLLPGLHWAGKHSTFPQLSHAGIRNLLAIGSNKCIIIFPSTVKNKS